MPITGTGPAAERPREKLIKPRRCGASDGRSCWRSFLRTVHFPAAGAVDLARDLLASFGMLRAAGAGPTCQLLPAVPDLGPGQSMAVAGGDGNGPSDNRVRKRLKRGTALTSFPVRCAQYLRSSHGAFAA